MAKTHSMKTPLTDSDTEKVKIGDKILLNGVIYTARDAAHKRLIDLIDLGKELPIDIEGHIIYYVGPTPPKPGRVIGSAGPTTSYRMDPYAPKLLALGLKAMIGKGKRAQEVIEALGKYKALYLGATGGAAALLSKRIVKAEVVAYEDLGTEAIRRLEVEDFPVVVINDIHGNELYQEGQKGYRRG